MKKIIFILIYMLAISHTASSQDLNKIMADLAKTENVVHQVLDQEILNTALKNKKKDMPPVVEKLTGIEVVVLENGSASLRDSISAEISNFKDGNDYETLLRVKDGKDNVRIISHKESDTLSSVYIIVIDEDDVVFVKMSGNLSKEDMMDIVKEQQKNK